MNKENVGYIHNGILFNHEKEGNSAICYSIDNLESLVLSEISRERQILYNLTYMLNLKKTKQNSETESILVVIRDGR